MTETQNEEIEVEDVEVEEVEEVVAEKVSRAPGHILVGIDLGTCRTVIV